MWFLSVIFGWIFQKLFVDKQRPLSVNFLKIFFGYLQLFKRKFLVLPRILDFLRQVPIIFDFLKSMSSRTKISFHVDFPQIFFRDLRNLLLWIFWENQNTFLGNFFKQLHIANIFFIKVFHILTMSLAHRGYCMNLLQI